MTSTIYCRLFLFALTATLVGGCASQSYIGGNGLRVQEQVRPGSHTVTLDLRETNYQKIRAYIASDQADSLQLKPEPVGERQLRFTVPKDSSVKVELYRVMHEEPVVHYFHHAKPQIRFEVLPNLSDR
jgi:hypothetical protein